MTTLGYPETTVATWQAVWDRGCGFLEVLVPHGTGRDEGGKYWRYRVWRISLKVVVLSLSPGVVLGEVVEVDARLREAPWEMGVRVSVDGRGWLWMEGV